MLTSINNLDNGAEISELKSGGLVSSNLQKFSSGNIISSTSSNHVPSKLQETTHFVGTVQQKVLNITYICKVE